MRETVEYESYGVIKVSGSNPEAFWIAFANPKPPAPRGLFMHTSGNLSESEARTALAKMGLDEARIDLLIEKARANQS